MAIVSASLVPAALALTAASLFGVSAIPAKRGLSYVDAQTGALIAIATVVCLYVLSAVWWMRADEWFTTGFWVFVLAGLMHPMLSMYFGLEAIQRAGATVASTLAATSPFFAALTAVLFLGENVTALIAIGTFTTVIGVMTLSWSPHGVTQLMRTTLFFATGAAVIRGLIHTIGKWGLVLLPNVFMAGFVSFSVGLIGMLTIHRLRHGRFPTNLPPTAVVYFAVSGVLIGVAVLCMYTALLTGDVVVVSPIVAAYPVFTLLAVMLLREERMTTKIIAGVVLVGAGVALISVGNRMS